MKDSLLRIGILGAGILVTIAGLGTRAEAQNYPWCAYYGGRFGGGGGTNCGFTTFEQCLATVNGIGGFCARNTQYVAPPGPHDQPARKKRTHS